MTNDEWGELFREWYSQKPRNRMYIAYQCRVDTAQIRDWLRGVVPRRHVTRKAVHELTGIDVDGIINRHKETKQRANPNPVSVDAPTPSMAAYLSELPRIRAALDELVTALR